MTKILDNNHKGSVLQIDEYRGVPVLVHEGGHYPTLLDDSDNTIHRYIDVGRFSDGYHVEARGGWNEFGRRKALPVGIARLLTELPDLYRAAHDTLLIIDTLYREARAFAGRWHRSNGPLSRDGYEAAAIECGFTARTDDALAADCSMHYGEYEFPSYPIAELAWRWAGQRRVAALNADKGRAEEATRRARVSEEIATIGRLRLLPATGHERRLLPGYPAARGEFLRDGVLYTVIGHELHTISEDDPAIHGAHLLGHEGERGEFVTLEIRVGK